MDAVYDHAQHTPYSDPGQYAELIEDLAIDPESLSAVARNLIVHYRASGLELPQTSRNDINARWLEDMLALDQARHGLALDTTRPETERVQGCCRDHTLFCVGALRQHGVPARSRVGYAGYFVDGWHHDHVVVEAWLDGRWRRFDPEVEDRMDMAKGAMNSTDFVTAAQVWHTYRLGQLDADTYGVDPNVPVFRGERFIFDEVIYEVAHRYGDELLLWDGWGRIGEPGSPVSAGDAAWADGVVALLLAADDGDTTAEATLLDQYRNDEGLHPGPVIEQASPYGDPVIEVALRR